MSLGVRLETALDFNEEIRFKQKNKAFMIDIAKVLHFSYDEVERIMLIYYKILKRGPFKAKGISRVQLRSVLHNGLDLTDYELMDNILAVLDKGVNPFVSMANWGKMLSLFLRGSLEEKIKYSYAVYNNMGNETVMVRNNMIHLLRHSLIKEGSEEDDEGVKDMVDMIIKRMDFDHDGKVSYEDFRESVLGSPLLLQAFGPVLPTRLATHAFLTSFTENVGKL